MRNGEKSDSAGIRKLQPVKKFFALLIAILFHPLFLFFYSICLFLQLLPHSESGNPELFAALFIATILIPFALILLCRAAGLISSLQMPERKDRHLPHLLTFIVYIGAFFFLKKELQQTPVAAGMLVGTVLCLGLTGLITLFWKISSHMAGIGGFSGFFTMIYIAENQAAFLIAALSGLFFAGLIGLSRFYLKAHTLWQLLAGFFLGIACSSVSLCFFAELF